MRARDKLRMNALHFKSDTSKLKLAQASDVFVNTDVTRKLVELLLTAFWKNKEAKNFCILADALKITTN
jgi:hypothetical protein